MPGVRTTLRMAKEMGARLGKRKILQRAVPEE